MKKLAPGQFIGTPELRVATRSGVVALIGQQVRIDPHEHLFMRTYRSDARASAPESLENLRRLARVESRPRRPAALFGAVLR